MVDVHTNTQENQMDIDNKPIPNTGKNPYEIRLDLLHLAKDVLEQNARHASGDREQITVDDVINMAESLNKFVSAGKS